MRESFILPPIPLITCQEVKEETDRIILQLQSKSITCPCPVCNTISLRIHSAYYRQLADLPVCGKKIMIHFKVYKFFCDHPSCRRKIFTQRFDNSILPYGRRLPRLTDHLQSVALRIGANQASVLCQALAMAISSASTLLRLIKKMSIPVFATPKVLGVDDWSFKRGKHFGTILVDLEKHRVIDLLADRESHTLQTWLASHPGIEVISPDRAGNYALAAQEGAPAAIQVADRWHLLKNLGDTTQRFLESHRSEMKQASLAVAEALLAVIASAETIQEVITHSPSLGEKVTMSDPVSEAVSLREEKYQKVKILQAKGISVKAVAKLLGMSRTTISKYWKWQAFQPKTIVKRSRIVNFEPYLRKRWFEGQTCIRQLYREIQAQGFKGGFTTLFEFMKSYPREAKASLAASIKTKLYSPRQVSIWLSKKEEEIKESEIKAYIASFFDVCQQAKQMQLFIIEFKDLMNKRQADELDAWIEKAFHSGIDALKNFVIGLQQDYAAVKQAFSSIWSNGQVEGQVNRLKNIKRQYGRASFELLRRRVILGFG
jgi:transposase